MYTCSSNKLKDSEDAFLLEKNLNPEGQLAFEAGIFRSR